MAVDGLAQPFGLNNFFSDDDDDDSWAPPPMQGGAPFMQSQPTHFRTSLAQNLHDLLEL